MDSESNGEGEDENDNSSSNQEEADVQNIPWMSTNPRVGMTPGAGPQGSEMASFEDLPDNIDVLKGMYIELQKSFKDLNAVRHQQEQSHWFMSSGEEGDDLKSLLSHFYTRGMELVGVLAAITFVIQLYIYGSELPPLAQGSGAIAATAVFDRWIRPALPD